MKRITLTLLTTLSLTFGALSQAPCGTNFTGFDPCSAEFLGTAQTCAGSAETFQTNTCNGTNPTTSSCGLAVGANIVWGTFVVTSADTYTITWTASNNRNIRMGLYQYTDACLMSGETEVACVNNGGNGVDETLSLFLNPGTYYVCGESSGDLAATSEICVSAPSVPPPVIASDCNVGVDVCTNLSFAIDPNGEGTNTTEIPASGSLGNPLYDGFTTFNPWGTTNMGCLQIDESNSTWMRVNIFTGGNLEFTFGGSGTQAGFYDWIMYPATAGCTEILSHTVAPVRCNWNGVDNGGTGLADIIPSGGDATNFEPSLPVVAGEVYIICFSNYSSIQTSVPLDFGGTAVVSCSPLPVELINFQGAFSEEQNATVLNWETLSERDNDRFIVQRSVGDKVFEDIGEVKGAGFSNEKLAYEFIDRDFLGGQLNYYRLKQVDYNGEYEYSEIISVNTPLPTMQLYPNPTSGWVKLNTVLISEGAEVHVCDVQGRRIATHVISTSSTDYQLDCSHLQKGTYVISVFNETKGSVSQKLIVE